MIVKFIEYIGSSAKSGSPGSQVTKKARQFSKNVYPEASESFLSHFVCRVKLKMAYLSVNLALLGPNCLFSSQKDRKTGKKSQKRVKLVFFKPKIIKF